MLEPFEGGRRCQLTSTSAVKFLYGNNSILYKCIVNLYIRFLYLQNISAIFEKIEVVCNRDYEDCCKRMRLSVITPFCSKEKFLRKKRDDTRIYGKRTHLIHFKE